VIAQWIAAGLALIRGATTSGRGLVGGAVALWRLAQAVRLAILLARRLRDAPDAPRAGAPGAASTPVPAWCPDAEPLDDAAPRPGRARSGDRRRLDRRAAGTREPLGPRRGPPLGPRASRSPLRQGAPTGAQVQQASPRPPDAAARPAPPPPAWTRTPPPATMAHAGRPQAHPAPDRPPGDRARPVGSRRRADVTPIGANPNRLRYRPAPLRSAGVLARILGHVAHRKDAGEDARAPRPLAPPPSPFQKSRSRMGPGP
jgi:hypothetical protein